MTQEDKDLLLKDLRSRLPYGERPVHTLGVFTWKDDEPTEKTFDGTLYDRLYLQLCVYKTDYMNFKPYLRPMSSMTEEEKEELCNLCTPVKVFDEDTQEYLYTSYYVYFGYKEEDVEDDEITIKSTPLNYFPIDWLNTHHFDYRGLIERGLALKAEEWMYEDNYDYD